MTKNKFSCKEAIVKSVLETAIKSNEINDVTRNEAFILADDMLEDINKWSIKVNSCSRSIRCSPLTMRITLSQFIDSKKGYGIWRNSQLQPRSSMSALKALKKKITQKGGTFPMLCFW